MKRRLLVLLVLVCLSARAWDVEHDEIAQLTAEALPLEIRSFFTFDDFGILMANCHYPDWIEWAMPDGSRRSHTLAEMAESVGEEDAALLKEQGISESIDFHGTRPRAVLLTMLARAFGRGDHARAAFYLSLLTHVVSDIAALNHPPLQQFARYSQFPGVDYPSRKVEAGAKNDFGFRSDGHVVHLVRERMRGYSPKPFAADWSTALLAFAVDEVRQGAFAAEKEGVVAFAPQPEAEAALVDLVAMQVCALEDMVATAWRFRSPAAAFPVADFDAALARESGRLAAEIDPARQAVFAEVFDMARNPAQPKGTVYIVCEPYGYLACRSLSFVGRIIVAIAARTLRDAGYAVRGVTLSSVGKTGLPKPAEADAVLVSLGPGEVDDAVARAFRAYREQGGRLIALGGYDPKNVTGLRDLLERQADDAVPVSSQWGVCNEEVWNRMSVVFAGRTYPFVRNPNINGYCKPYASYVFSIAADVRPLLVLDNGRSRRVAGVRKGRVVWLPEYALMPFVLSESRTFDWTTLRLDEPGRSILLAALDGNAARIVLPEKYHRDPGAEFALVFVTDLAEPTEEVRSFADAYKDAVFVCAKGTDRAALLDEVCENYRVYRFPRGRIDLESSDLAKPEAKKCLENYIRWGRYQTEPPALTRYGARIYRRERKAGDAPSVKLPEGWRLVEGDDGVTGCDSRLFYFTIEADGAGLPPPEVAVSWPDVAISSVDGATNVTFAADGVVLTPIGASGGTNYLTMVQDGAIELALHHHVEGAQHGPYGGRTLPWTRIRASDNWRAACREIFHRAGLADPKATGGASIKLYGFDSNFPNRHVDHPEHFHVMLEWNDWRKNNVGHYTLDEKGFIRGNNFLVCGDITGGLPNGYHPQKPGETTEYVGPSGKPLFSLEMLEGGFGLVLRRPGSDAMWRLQSDRPAESIQISVRSNAASEWKALGSCSVTDDTEQGRYVICCEDKGELRTETFRYERDTGRLIGSPVRSNVRKVLNIVNFVRGCEPRDDANRDHLDEPLREEIARNTKYGFRNTILLQYDALLRDELVSLAKTAQQDRTEYGVWVEMCRQLVEACGIGWESRYPDWDWDWFVKPGFLMAYTPEQRERICDELFRLFKERFGAYPKTMGSWMLDAHSMDYVQRKYGVRAFLICREQDATDAYTLNGGYFNGAYYPSKKNALSAAVDMKNAILAPVFRMLTPDPIYNYGSYANAGFNTYTTAGCPTMEPIGNPDVAWYFKTYGEPVAPLNLCYMQTGQENSFFWSRIHKSLDEQLEMAAKCAAEGKIATETVSETAERFMRDHPENCPQTQIALVDRTGANRKSVWYNAKRYRANLFFEDGKVRFRDIHVMDDADEEDWLKAACPDWHAEYHTPFVVDEKRLSTSSLVLGGVYTDLRCAGDGKRTLTVEAVKTDGSVVTVTFGEDCLKVKGAALSCHNAKARELLARFEVKSGVFDFARPRAKDEFFEAPWIGDGEKDRVEATFYDEDPAPEFMASFVLPKGVSLAKVTIACAGYYAIKLNGQAAGVSATTLMPLWSPFDRTIYADTFEAKGLLPFPATNVVSVTLGNGFYNLPPLRFWGSKCFRESLAHGRPCFKLSVEGVTEPLRWTYRKTNILRNCVYLGTEVDATRGPTDGRPAAHVFGPRGAIVPRRAPAVDFTGSAEGRLVARPDGTYLVDFGANLSGVPRFEFAGEPRGRKIKIVYGERLNADGSVNVLTQTAGQIKKPGRGGPGAPDIACQRDVYVCGGVDEEVFEPPFTWHICRYAEIRGATHLPKSARLKVVSSALKAVADPDKIPAEFKTLHEVCVRTFRDNLIGVQSDCPGRERLGYGGDIVATCEAMCLNFDMLEFYLKTLQDFADEAEGDGWVTETAPFVGIADADGLEAGGASRKGPVSWALAVPVLMDTLLRHYPSAADRILAHYPVCARYVRLMALAHPTGLVPKCIGDHEALERAPDEVTATAHWYEFVRLTASFARRTGRGKDADEFSALAEGIKSAFQRAYVKAGIVANGTQSAQAMALYLGLVPEDQVKAAERRLVEAIEEKDCAPYTGIFSARYMLEYLSTHGYDALACKLVLHRGFPGWLHMLENGATTLWETWKESDDIYSNCHPMFGSVDEWILKYGYK